MKTAIQWVEKGLVPKPLIRRGIRSLLGKRLEEQQKIWTGDPEKAMGDWVRSMGQAPIALVPEKANEQHYELPPEFFQLVLGPHRKYSSAFYESDSATLEEAELSMLELTCQRAGLQNRERILELGCGWGSLTLHMAKAFPQSEVVGVSNSAPQRSFIEARARAQGLRNVTILTCDMNGFEAPGKFDRIVSVEMFEHIRNWEALLGRAAGWLNPGGTLFMHIFAHKSYAYPFEDRGEEDWMGRFFFSGGMMPSHGLFDHLDTPFALDERWRVSGQHYARTSEDWNRNLERKRTHVMPILRETYGAEGAKLWFHRWRVFFLSCAELFAWDGGDEWFVTHQRLRLKEGERA